MSQRDVTLAAAFIRRLLRESAQSPRLGWPLTVLHINLRMIDINMEWQSIAAAF